MKIDRRRALSLLAWTGVLPAMAEAASSKPHAGAVRFAHGVASGDPLADRVLLWTRVTPAGNAARIDGNWEVADDAAFKHIAAHGPFATGPGRDFTVKADAAGLKPGRDYFYRFRVGATLSPVGRARTLPTGSVKDVVLAFVSCSLYPAGYFNAYDHIAKLERVDAVVELGDYLYEYGAGADDYGMDAGRRLNRIPDPPHEIVTLADYRRRHALYKSDPDLQAAHARAPWICVWDDHESANDCWMGGAENHDPAEEGSWLTREAAALQAYYEWMPIREPARGQAAEAINRAFAFGDLASLIMLESRLVARSQQIDIRKPGRLPLAVYDARHNRVRDAGAVGEAAGALYAGMPTDPYTVEPDWEALNAILNDPDRQMLGPRQELWLAEQIAASVRGGQAWQVLGNQVVMARQTTSDFRKAFGVEKTEALLAQLPEARRALLRRSLAFNAMGLPADLDGWNGYPAARERLYDAIKASSGNVVVVSGDSHAFWVNELKDAAGTTRVAAEFGTSAITSPSLGDALPMIDAGKIIAGDNPEVLMNDQRSKGYVLLTLTREKAHVELVAVEIAAKPYAAAVKHRYEVAPAEGPGIGAIVEVS